MGADSRSTSSRSSESADLATTPTLVQGERRLGRPGVFLVSLLPRTSARVHVDAEFGLDAAAGTLETLAMLGIDWVHLPHLLPTLGPGWSDDHIIEHGGVDPALGGHEALARFTRVAHRLGLGVLVELPVGWMSVAVPQQNSAWWDVLKFGQESDHARAFDIDWALGPRLRLPVLDGSIEDAAASGRLRVDRLADTLHYLEHVFPLAPGSADGSGDALAVHSRQRYELVARHGTEGLLNYRHSHADPGLAAVRVELPDVFDASHRGLFGWVTAGLIDGVLVERSDELLDPGAYLARLAVELSGCALLIDTGLHGASELPSSWPIHGTSCPLDVGPLDRLLVEPVPEPSVELGEDSWSSWNSSSIASHQPELEVEQLSPDPHDIEAAEWMLLAKRRVADSLLGAPVRRLMTMHLNSGGPGESPSELDAMAVGDAMAELLACLPVPRAELPAGRAHLEAAIASAARRRPDLAAAIDEIAAVLRHPRRGESIRFQQTAAQLWGATLEVARRRRMPGLAPANTETPGAAAASFHAHQASRMCELPNALTPLLRQASGRSEDARARCAALVEFSAEWSAFLARRRARLGGKLHPSGGVGSPVDDASAEALFELLVEAVVCAWPASQGVLRAAGRAALREAAELPAPSEQLHEWTNSAPDWRAELLDRLLGELVSDPKGRSELEAFVRLVEGAGWSNGLTATLLHLAAPGIPEIDPGARLRSLVAPNGGRADEYADRFAEFDDGWLPPLDGSGAAKLLVVSRTLQLRRDRPELFTGYRPVLTRGMAAGHVVGFDRGGAVAVATRLPVALAARGGWGDTTVMLPSMPYVDMFTRRLFLGGRTLLRELLGPYPVALLAKLDEV